jgi:superfamily II DNA/RNA helicase|tara:strand:+ start:1040 stop:2560 length:1521 start_codon:yes stop_codon:yes gene_type:complete
LPTSFSDLGVPAVIARALSAHGITAPFSIQSATIPDGLAGRDICGRAPTGSGKTIAFGIPLVARTAGSRPKAPAALVLAPTRELAEQIAGELRPMAQALDLWVMAAYGGTNINRQIDRLAKGVDILVACPGRLHDLLDRKALTLGSVSTVVIDEADRMADMGFLPDVRRILDLTNENRQTLLFSATLDGDVAALTRDYQTDPVRHEVGDAAPDVHSMDHYFWSVNRPSRILASVALIRRAGKTVVFTRTRHGADRAAQQLRREGVEAVAIHGGRSQNQRDRALDAFSGGEALALIATDVAARGIHIDNVACVLHFDPPEDEKAYLHRSGRTARAGASGTVVCLVDVSQKKAVKQLQRKLGLDIPITPPTYEGVEITYPAPSERKGSQDTGTPKKSSNRRSDDGSNPQNIPRVNRTGLKGSNNRRSRGAGVSGARAPEKDSNESDDRPARGGGPDRTGQGTTRKKRNGDKSHGGGSRGGGSQAKKTSRGDGRPVAKKRNTANSKGRR